jgi:hypothetical protein
MTGGELITQVVQFGYDIQDRTAAALVAQDIWMRRRILRSLQAGCETIRNAYPWTWRHGTGTATVTSADYDADVPVTFQTYGPRCTIYRVSDGVELVRRPLSELRRLAKESPSTDKPAAWAPSGDAIFAVYPAGTGNPTLTMQDYLATCPELTDEEDTEQTNDGTELDEAVPERYQRSLLFDWCVIDLKLYGGDDNYLPMRLEWEKRLRQAWADENLMPGVVRVPRYGRGHLRA